MGVRCQVTMKLSVWCRALQGVRGAAQGALRVAVRPAQLPAAEGQGAAQAPRLRRRCRQVRQAPPSARPLRGASSHPAPRHTSLQSVSITVENANITECAMPAPSGRVRAAPDVGACALDSCVSAQVELEPRFPWGDASAAAHVL